MRCQDAVLPALLRRGGRLLSARADNLLLTYPDALSAALAARQAQRLLRHRNRARKPRDRFHLCMGIDAGPVVELADDVFGTAVNLASKLGEDLADRDEILLTGEAVLRLQGRLRTGYARSTQIGGQVFELHRLPY
jgi:class 3 adenylate cyclase